MLSSQVLHLRRELADVKAEQRRQANATMRQLGRINGNVLRVANRPAFRGALPAPDANLNPPEAAVLL